MHHGSGVLGLITRGIDSFVELAQQLLGDPDTAAQLVQARGILTDERGNVALKASEGLASMIGGFLKKSFSVNIFTKIAGLIAYPALTGFKKLVDHRRHNGAALLGLRGLVFKSHGSADILAFEVALSRAYDAANNQLLARVERRLAQAAPLLAAATAAEAIT